MPVGAGGERDVPDLDPDPYRRAALDREVGRDLPGEPDHLAPYLGPVVEIALVRGLPAAGARRVRRVGHRRVVPAARQPDQPRPDGGPEGGGENGRDGSPPAPPPPP